MDMRRILVATVTAVLATAMAGGAGAEGVHAAPAASAVPLTGGDADFLALLEETQSSAEASECAYATFPGGTSCTCNCFWDGCSVNCQNMPNCYCRWGFANCECDNPWPPEPVVVA